MIKKILIFTLLFFSFAAYADEEELTPISAGIRYDEASARIEAFKDIAMKIDRKNFKKFMYDPNYKENIASIKNKNLEIENRSLFPFYAKNTLVIYSLIYDEIPNLVLYYNTFGTLMKFDIVTSGDYPKKIYSYSKYGNLVTVTFSVSEEQQFVYEKNGKLIAHWEGREMVQKETPMMRLLNINRGLAE